MSARVTHRRLTGRAGFTLIELLVALGLSAVIAVGLYSISMVASQTFQQQQRISELQLRLRIAAETLRADVARAGYMATPSSTNDPRVCPRPAVPVQGVWLQRDTTNPTHNLSANTGILPVTLRLTGNFLTTDEYLVMGVQGSTVFLQQRTRAFGRLADATTFERTFTGRMVRIMGTNGVMQFAQVQDVTYAAPTGTVYPSIRLTAAPTVIGGSATGGAGSTSSCGLPGLGVGATIAPITIVDYAIRSTAATLSAANQGSAPFTTGKTDLVRTEMNASAGGPTAVAGTERIVAEYAVDFDVAAVVADSVAAGTGDPTIRQLAFGDAANFTLLGTAGGGGRPEVVRSLVVRLSVRDRTQDPDFGWVPGRAYGTPLTRFQLFTGQSGAARVRTMTTEIALPNIATRNLGAP